jgi:hypothetical protein
VRWPAIAAFAATGGAGRPAGGGPDPAPQSAKLAVDAQLRAHVEQRWHSAGHRSRSRPGWSTSSPTIRGCGSPTRRSTPRCSSRPRGALRAELTACLRTRRVRRRPQRRVLFSTPADPRDKVMISQRPSGVADRLVAGHWEGDLIVGQANKSYVGTLVERTTRFIVLLHLPDGPSDDQVIAALATKLDRLPAQLCRSVTWDQGIEMVNNTRFAATPASRCTSLKPARRGSAAAREHQRAATPVPAQGQRPAGALRQATWTPSPKPSTSALDRPSDGRHHQRHSARSLRSPLEGTVVWESVFTRRRHRPQAGRGYGTRAYRRPPQRVDRVVSVELPAFCLSCGGELVLERVAAQHVKDLPATQTLTIRYLNRPGLIGGGGGLHVGRCPVCGRRVQPRHPGQTSDALGWPGPSLVPWRWRWRPRPVRGWGPVGRIARLLGHLAWRSPRVASPRQSPAPRARVHL